MNHNRNIYIEYAWRRLDQLTKPPRSLGRVEEIAAQLCGIQKTDRPKSKPRSVIVFAGDHGVCEEGVSAFSQSVTGEMLKNMASGGAAVSVLSRLHQAKLRVIDVGSKWPEGEVIPGVERCIIQAGTNNITKRPAMTLAQMEDALEVGEKAVREEIEQGTKLMIFGEMGIGNTTSASAICAAVLQCPVEDITGRGSGVNDAVFEHKVSVIKTALQLHKSELNTPRSILSHLGGFEIAAMVGGILEAGAQGLPVLLDGFIVTTAALLAAEIRPTAFNGLIAGHVSAEQGHVKMFEQLQLEPLLNLNMRLGEASGALIALPIIDAAIELFNEMATFESAGVSEKTT